MTAEARTIGIAIDRNWRELYEEFFPPPAFARWASGMSEAGLREQSGSWVGQGPQRPIRVRFTPRNEFGILDHIVTPEGGADIHVPLRILANGDGAEVILTLFRQPGMNDNLFERDASWVAKDLATLKAVAERDQLAG